MSGTYWKLVDSAASEHPDRVVLVDDYGRSLTSAQLREAALTAAAGLAERGIVEKSVVDRKSVV